MEQVVGVHTQELAPGVTNGGWAGQDGGTFTSQPVARITEPAVVLEKL